MSSSSEKPGCGAKVARMYVYAWSDNTAPDGNGGFLEEGAEECTDLRAYGMDEDGESVCLHIRGFVPHVYATLQTREGATLDEKEGALQRLLARRWPFMRRKSTKGRWTEESRRLSVTRECRPGLYGAKGEFREGAFVETPRVFYRIDVPSGVVFRRFLREHREPYAMGPADGKAVRQWTEGTRQEPRKEVSTWTLSADSATMQLHGAPAPFYLMLAVERDLPVTGWIAFDIENRAVGVPTRCRNSHATSAMSLRRDPEAPSSVPRPLTMAFDIEVYGSQPDVFPDGSVDEDAVFQIACVFSRDGVKGRESHLLCIGDCAPETRDSRGPGADAKVSSVTVHACRDEAHLLQAFSDLVKSKSPIVVTGYNIHGFDTPYLIARASRLTSAKPLPDTALSAAGKGPCGDDVPRSALVSQRLGPDFFCLGMPTELAAPARTRSMTTAAHGEEKTTCLETEGVVWLDMLPIIKKSFASLSSYSLQAVAEEFLHEGKDPVSVTDIMEAYRVGVLGDASRGKNWSGLACPLGACDPRPGASPRCAECRRAILGVVGRYCVVDAELCLRLMEYHNTWLAQTEMSAVCDTQIHDLNVRGQQARVYAQIYRQCAAVGRVVERPPADAASGGKYQGAYVKEPVPGLYRNVVPFDFASLYPSSMISHNIDFSTFLPEGTCPDVPDSQCHIIAWDDHSGCQHSRKEDITGACEKVRHRYRFLKQTAGPGGAPRLGVLPAVVCGLLKARKDVRRQIAALEEEARSLRRRGDAPRRLEAIDELCKVLDARQKAYKISANAAYGGLGASTGPLPFRIGAMATTAVGRKSFAKVENQMRMYGGVVVYGDTDSNYVTFPEIGTPQETWDHALHVANEISKTFPDPMRLEFENAVYEPFLILTMKQYMYVAVDRDGVAADDGKIKSRGVLLQRRDKSGVLRECYREVVGEVFAGRLGEVCQTILNAFTRCLRRTDWESFVITRAAKRGGVRERDGSFRAEEVPGKPHMVRVGAYEVRRLPGGKGGSCGGGADLADLADLAKRQKMLRDAGARDEAEFYLTSVPAPVVLADRMRSRGLHVEAGERIAYVVTLPSGCHPAKGKLSCKIESIEYFRRFSSVLSIDRLWYLESFVNPLDQLLDAIHSSMDERFRRDGGRGFRSGFAAALFSTFLSASAVHAEIRSLYGAPAVRRTGGPLGRNPEIPPSKKPKISAVGHPNADASASGPPTAKLPALKQSLLGLRYKPPPVIFRRPDASRGAPRLEGYIVRNGNPEDATRVIDAWWKPCLAGTPPVVWTIESDGSVHRVASNRLLQDEDWQEHIAERLRIEEAVCVEAVRPTNAAGTAARERRTPVGRIAAGMACVAVYRATRTGASRASFSHACIGGGWRSARAGASWVPCQENACASHRPPPAGLSSPSSLEAWKPLPQFSAMPMSPARDAASGRRRCGRAVASWYWPCTFQLDGHVFVPLRPGLARTGCSALISASGELAFHPQLPSHL